MFNKKLIVLASIFIFLLTTLTLVIAYQDEIEITAQKVFEKYFSDKADSTLSPEEKAQFEDFSQKQGADKFVSLIVNKKQASDKGASDD